MVDTIKLSIQEIIKDFEELVRYDERLGIYFDFDKASDRDIEDFSKRMEELAYKYLPNTAEDYMKDVEDEYDKGLRLYKVLYSNFVEMFTQLV